MPIDDADTVPTAVARRHGAAFWAVAFAFLIVMAFATLPSPLYGLYRVRDHLSALTVTVVYAVFAGGTIATLILERVVVGRIGRRGAMLGAVATMIGAAARPLSLPYVVFIALGGLAHVGLAAAPETGAPSRHATARLAVAGIPVPAAAATIAAFSATGLFAGLSGLFLATTLHRPTCSLAPAVARG